MKEILKSNFDIYASIMILILFTELIKLLMSILFFISKIDNKYIILFLKQ